MRISLTIASLFGTHLALATPPALPKMPPPDCVVDVSASGQEFPICKEDVISETTFGKKHITKTYKITSQLKISVRDGKTYFVATVQEIRKDGKKTKAQKKEFDLRSLGLKVEEAGIYSLAYSLESKLLNVEGENQLLGEALIKMDEDYNKLRSENLEQSQTILRLSADDKPPSPTPFSPIGYVQGVIQQSGRVAKQILDNMSESPSKQAPSLSGLGLSGSAGDPI